ncbi:MAG: hypothetical protein VYC34_03705, partial [Planctomycetota bacterium]|nr:hypothetical protein [Planctomycetota bacterium]
MQSGRPGQAPREEVDMGRISNAMIAIAAAAVAANAALASGISVSGPISIWGGARVEAAGSKAVVATNSTASPAIHMGDTAVLDGDAFCGVGANPVTSIVTWGDAEITGQRAALSTPLEFATISAPQGMPASEGHVALWGTNSLAISTDRCFDSIQIHNDAWIDVSGDVTVQVFGNVELTENARFRILDGGSLTLYVGGNIQVHNNAELNVESGDSGAMSVFLYGQNSAFQV